MFGAINGREAQPASAGWIGFKTFVQVVIIWSLFLFVFPVGIYNLEGALALDGWRFSSAASALCGAILFVLWSSLGLLSAYFMVVQGRGTPLPADCARKLVVVGPYRYVRNPMALAGICQGISVGICLGSPAVILYALLGVLFWNYVLRPWEEMDLERRFGAPYRHYRDSIRCWLPSIRPYQPSAELTGAESEKTRINNY